MGTFKVTNKYNAWNEQQSSFNLGSNNSDSSWTKCCVNALQQCIQNENLRLGL